MFGIGFWEMFVIAVLLLVAVGPDRLPQMVKTVARFYRQFRRTADEFRASSGIDELLRDEELRELAEFRKHKLASLTAAPKAAAAAAPAMAYAAKNAVPTSPMPLGVVPPDAKSLGLDPIDPEREAIIQAKLAAAHMAPDGAPVARGTSLGGELRRGADRADRMREYPPEGVDVVEARRYEPQLTEAELADRKARVLAKLQGLPIEAPREPVLSGGEGKTN